MTLRAGVIGLGVGEQHLLAYASHRGCEIAAICDLRPDRLEAVGGGYPGARLTTDPAEVLGASDIDVVSIASFDDIHFEQALTALRAGKHVFVEKPLCRSLDELRALKAAWSEKSGVLLASNLVLRAGPLFRWLRELVSRGDLGELYAFDGDYLYGRMHKITEGWRRDVEDYSVMLGGGVHLVDLMLWITGEKPAAVTATGNRISTSGTSFRYADFMAATFDFPSGLVGRISANFGSVHRHQHVVRVFGTRATVINDDQGARIHRSRDPADEPERVELSAHPEGKGDLIPGFVDAILNGKGAVETVQHEFDVISVCLAADRALAKGERVDIEYV